MQKEQLLELRSKIVQTAQEIALRGEGSPAERLQILLSIVRSGDASLDVLAKAYELSQAMESDDDKLSALLDVLYEVDAKLSQDDQPVEAHNSEHDHHTGDQQ